MSSDTTVPMAELVKQATDIVIRFDAFSISLLQRHLRVGYSRGIELSHALEAAGIVTPAGQDGYRGLTSYARSLRSVDSPLSVRELCEAWALDPFEGGDGGDAGSPESRSIWVFGQEHGDAINGAPVVESPRYERDYSIDRQLSYPFNRNAFKLFASLHGEPVENYEAFARRTQPWVPGSKGYLKGNLYPYPCRNLTTWSEQAVKDTGFEQKADFVKWCDEHRLQAIADAVRQHRPKLFIGVGANMAREFSIAYFGAALPLDTYQFSVNGSTKKIRYATHNGGRFVVLPHISSGSNGLNSDEALQIAGSFIAGLMRN
jgi:hypothetical protein